MWKHLEKGDVVEVVAPSFGVNKKQLEKAKKHLEGWGLVPRVSPSIFGNDMIYANSKDERIKNFIASILSEDSKAIWCIRGGSGSTQLIPYLSKTLKPKKEKVFVGFSDATSLHIFFHHKWGWSPLHGPVLTQMSEGEISKKSIELVKDIVFGKQSKFLIENLTPLNKLAEQSTKINSQIVGGNLSLIQYSLGTSWQLVTKNKVFFCEDVNEQAYRTSERLEHLKQNGLFDKCSAIIFCEFSFNKNESKTESSLSKYVIQKFAEESPVPTLMCSGIGHGKTNLTIPFGGKCNLETGKSPKISLFYH